ncbi:MAG: hypothetical protein LLG42_10555 [Chloroflexi bacterium]|nr:hypothetical protein [Chloroflexota bacterium]
MLLCVEHWCGDERLGEWEVLNEVAVARGRTVRPIHLVTEVDGHYLTTYIADGWFIHRRGVGNCDGRLEILHRFYKVINL